LIFFVWGSIASKGSLVVVRIESDFVVSLDRCGSLVEIKSQKKFACARGVGELKDILTSEVPK
jgi:hypothetical protein